MYKTLIFTLLNDWGQTETIFSFVIYCKEFKELNETYISACGAPTTSHEEFDSFHM